MMYMRILLLLCVISCACSDDPWETLDGAIVIGPFEVQQVRLSLGDNPDEMIVMWSTFKETQESNVTYGLQDPRYMWTTGSSFLFTDEGKEKRSQWFHKVVLKGLMPQTTYYYQCGSSLGWSKVFSFKTFPEGSDWSPRLAIFGDMGAVNAQSLERLENDTNSDMYHAIIHAGDFAYNMQDENGRVGDVFMREIECIAAKLPYMTCVGNHEASANFSHYKNTFSMPRDHGEMFYSFNMGPVHFISVSTEYYYFVQYGVKQVIFQYRWLVKDLEEATKPENRKKRPWIVMFGHRPMYCSNSDRDDCTKHETLVRVGVPIVHWYGLEELVIKYGVDLTIWAHEHSYERLWPIYNRKVYNGSYEQPYTNPRAPTHIITGSAGCRERHDNFIPNKPSWSAFRSTDYGYTRMHVHNNTHMYLEQVSDDKNGTVIDWMWLVRDKHEPYNL